MLRRLPQLWLWFGCGETALLATCDAGLLAAALALYGGPASPWCLLASWAVWVRSKEASKSVSAPAPV